MFKLRDVARDLMIRCAREAGVEPGLVIQLRRERRACEARDRAVALVRWSTGASSPEIAHAFGFMDHTTVLAAVKRHEERLNAASPESHVEERRLDVQRLPPMRG